MPAHDKEASAQFFAKIFGLTVEPPFSHFAVVKVNDKLTFDFANMGKFKSHHYAFHVSDDEFDSIFTRIKEAGIEYSSILSIKIKARLIIEKEGVASTFLIPMATT